MGKRYNQNLISALRDARVNVENLRTGHNNRVEWETYLRSVQLVDECEDEILEIMNEKTL